MGLENISDNPMDRVQPEMKKVLKKKDVPFDAHCHVFTKDNVPDEYLKIRIPLKEKFLSRVSHVLHRIISRTDTDILSRYAYFVQVMKSPYMETIAEKLFRYYDDHTLFGPETILCPMMMDLQANKKEKAGIKGRIKKPYPEQVREMKELVQNYPDRILPFLAVDPRREDVFDKIFVPAFESGSFFGVKIYPSLGYLPSHPELLKVYQVCVDRKIPVTVHCGTGSVRSSWNTLKDIPGLRYDPKTPGAPAEMTRKSKTLVGKKAFAAYFNHPKNWVPVLEMFPDLHLNLAHFGSTLEWKKYLENEDNTWPSRIIDLIYRYPNVYTDISYNIVERSQYRALRDLLKRNDRLRDRVLFGSDYYMTVKAGHFRTILADFTSALGQDLIRQMATVNVRRFLRLP